MVSKENQFDVLIIGAKGVGKKTFIEKHTNQDGSNDNTKTSDVDGTKYSVQYHIHNSSNPTKSEINLVLCCFAVNDVKSAEHVKQYIQNAQNAHYKLPMLVVGTKCDLRDDPSRSDMVSIEQGIELSEMVNASAFLECSATDGQTFDLDALQEEIVKIILHSREPSKKKTSNFSFGIVKFLLGK